MIGNGGYRHAPVLPNAVNDGRDIAEKLRGLDFEVYEGIDLDRAAMLALLEQFAGRIQGAEVGLFFFSGHALQVDNVNYLVPIDALVQSRSDIETALVDLPQILGRMEGASPVSIVMLDACRDNPLPGGAAPVLQQSVGTGLARVGARAGMLVAFSTAPGAVAVDSVGNAANSPFTLGLLHNLDVDGLEIRQMLTRVRADVVASTGGRQVPWDSSSLVADFYFTAPDQDLGQLALEEIYWRTIRDSSIVDDFRAYLRRFPSGAFADLAQARVLALTRAAEVAALAPAGPGGVIDKAVLRREAMAQVNRIPKNMIQYGLIALGFPVETVSGIMDPPTRRAVREYQSSIGETQTGELTSQQTVDLLLAAASVGDSHAQNAVGFMTASGVGFARDYRLARAWFGKAADQQDPYGYVNLATLYREGLGVDRDIGQARQLYEQAAKRGLTAAQDALQQLGTSP